MFKEYNGKSIIIMSCSDCNANCKHCYISYSGNLSGDKLVEMVKKLKDKYEIMINGTEPLMHRGFLEAYKLAKWKSPITNGLIFKNNYDYIDELKKYGIEELRISYHFDMHDQISPVDRNYLKELFKVIRAKNMKLCLMCSISSTTYRNIPNYCKEAIKLGATAIKFTNFLSQGRAKSMDDNLILNDKQLDEFFEILGEQRKLYDIHTLEIRRCGSFGNDLKRKSNFKCDAGTNNVCITPDMKVYPCIFLCKPGNEIGYYKNGKVFIDETYTNDGKNCLAKDTLNNR